MMIGSKLGPKYLLNPTRPAYHHGPKIDPTSVFSQMGIIGMAGFICKEWIIQVNPNSITSILKRKSNEIKALRQD